MTRMDMTKVSVLENPAITLYNNIEQIESSSISFFDEYSNELEDFLKKNKLIVLRHREIRHEHATLIQKLSKEHPEAYQLYTGFFNSQAQNNTEEAKKYGDKIDAIMESSDKIRDSMNEVSEVLQKFGEEPIANYVKESENLMQPPLEYVLDICERNVSDLEGTEKCVYFVFIAVTAFMYNQNLAQRFYKWLSDITRIYKSSSLIQLLNAFMILVILPIAEQLKFTSWRMSRDEAYLRLYNSIKQDPELSSRLLWKNLELTERNMNKENIFEELSSLLPAEIDTSRARNLWISFNISYTSFVIFYFQKLTNYDITQNLEQIQKSLERARSLDPQNPVANLIYGFTLIDDNGINAEKLFLDSLNQFDYYKINIFELFLTEMKSLIFIGLATIHNKRSVYDLAEKYYNEAFSYVKTEFLKCIVYLNRGKNSLDQGMITDAISDFNEAKKLPHTEALALTNLGKLYYNQGLFQKSESILLEAIDKDDSIPYAYYNLGVLYNDEGKIEDATKLFFTSKNLDRNFKEARDALSKITKLKKVEEKNFVIWWFKSQSTVTKAIGTLFLAFIIYFMGQAVNLTYHEKTVSNSIWIGLGVSMGFFLIPFLSKIKIGDVVELEMTSVTT